MLQPTHSMASRKRIIICIITFLAISITFVCHGFPSPRRPRFQFGQDESSEDSTSDDSWLNTASSHIAAADLSNNHTTQLVVGKLSHQDTSWLSDLVPTIPSIIYVTDNPGAPHHPPVNKGNEVMTYLTFIIEHYASLPSTSIFIHPHRYAWHNNDLLDNDMAEMLRHLNLERVRKEGYMNLRCQWGPGCPRWLKPNEGAVGAKMGKQEQLHIAKVWKELFPGVPLPEGLSGPCCGQFAVSKEAIQRLPLEKYVAMREWVLGTQLSDYVVGRCFEYLWQYIFTSREDVCPDQHDCYCDGYGLCFENDAEFQRWFEIRQHLIKKLKDLEVWEKEVKEWKELQVNGTWDQLSVSEKPAKLREDIGERMQNEIVAMEQGLADRKGIALQRGQDQGIRVRSRERERRPGDVS